MRGKRRQPKRGPCLQLNAEEISKEISRETSDEDREEEEGKN